MANFDYTNVSASLTAANTTETNILETWLQADAEQLATDAGNTDVTGPDMVIDDDAVFIELLAQAEIASVFDLSALSAPLQTDAADVLAKVNAEIMSIKNSAAFLALADTVGPVYAVASQAELESLMGVLAIGDSIVSFGANTIGATTRKAIQKLNNRDTAYILTEAGVADVTGQIYDVADQPETDAIEAQFFAMIKKKK
jgi:hypothetical protein